MSLSKRIYIALSGLAVVLVGIAVYLAWPSIPDVLPSFLDRDRIDLPEQHLIANVPYRGQYLGNSLVNQEPVAVRTLVDYWGIEGVTHDELKDRFEPSLLRNEEDLRAMGTRLIAEFFWGKFYDADGFATSSPELIKYLIANNIPVYVKQRLGSKYMPELLSTRIYIGYSDIENHFVVHDNNFGNNYTIPYDEYDAISAGQLILVVKPSDYQLSDRPQHDSVDPTSYPDRLTIMDDLGLRDLQVKIMEVNWYKSDALINKNDQVEAAVATLEDIVNHEAFERLHPAAQMTLSYNLTGFYMSEAPDLQRAIDILENVTLPLIENHDFSKPYGGWDRKMDPSVYDDPFFDAGPWTRLGYLYMRIGERDAARTAFDKALAYRPDFAEALTGLSMLDN